MNRLKDNDAFSEISYSETLSALETLQEYTETMCDFSANLLAENKAINTLPGADQSDMAWLHVYEFVNELSLRYHKDVDVVVSGLSDYVLSKDLIRLINSVVLQIFYHSIVYSIELPEKRHIANKKKIAVLDVRLVKNKNKTYHLTIRNDGEGVDVDQIKEMLLGKVANIDLSDDKIDKRKVCSALLYSCDPDAEKFNTYSGELLFGNELISRLKHKGVKSTMQNVIGEGSVFDFSFPIDS